MDESVVVTVTICRGFEEKECMRRYAQLLMLLAVFPLVCVGQSNSDRDGNKLTLQIHGEDLANGVPESFSFVLLNEGNRDIYLPNPEIRCEGRAYEGMISLVYSFKPYDPRDEAFGSGCTEENRPMPAIRERLKSWVALPPGKSLTLNATRQQLGYLDSVAGVFTFAGVYDPPYVDANDAGVLRSLGINYPRIKLKTDAIKFATEHKN
jgi:hypothetical protein